MSAERSAKQGASQARDGEAGGKKATPAPKQDELTQAAHQASDIASEAWQSGGALFDQAAQFVSTLQRGHGELGHQLTNVSAARPYVALGAAAGVGFVLGGGLTLGLTRRLFGLGGRLAVSMAMRRVMQAASEMA